HLRRGPPAVQAKLDVTVQAGSQLAEVQVVADLKAPNKDLAAVEWDLRSPRLTIASVTGEDVRAWKQTDHRLLGWLNRPAPETHFTLRGWWPVERRDRWAHLQLSGRLLMQAREQHPRLRLAAAADLALSSVRTNNLQPPPNAKTDDREWTFETRESPSY